MVRIAVPPSVMVVAFNSPNAWRAAVEPRAPARPVGKVGGGDGVEIQVAREHLLRREPARGGETMGQASCSFWRASRA